MPQRTLPKVSPDSSPAARQFLEMKEVEFNLWRHHPVTAAFLQFLRDQADSIRLVALATWEAGKLTEKHDLLCSLQGEAMAFEHLSTVTLSDICDSYRQEGTEELTDGAEASQEPAG